MSDPRERLDEFADGLLSPEETERINAALENDPGLHRELERVIRFKKVLEGLEHGTGAREVERILEGVRRTHRRRRIVVALAAAAAVLAILFGTRTTPTHEDDMEKILWQEAREFGRRLGSMAAARREGRVPRVGEGVVPSEATFGIVFEEALAELGVPLESDVAARVKDAVSGHFLRTRRLGGGVERQYRRSEASLALYRRLRSIAGTDVADAYYDVFRPGLADLETARRVPRGTLRDILSTAPERERYVREYEEAIELLEPRYGRSKLMVVLGYLAPDDRRAYWRDASQEGVGRDAVLAIRARIYRAAAAAGADKLYVDMSLSG